MNIEEEKNHVVKEDKMPTRDIWIGSPGGLTPNQGERNITLGGSGHGRRALEGRVGGKVF